MSGEGDNLPGNSNGPEANNIRPADNIELQNINQGLLIKIKALDSRVAELNETVRIKDELASNVDLARAESTRGFIAAIKNLEARLSLTTRKDMATEDQNYNLERYNGILINRIEALTKEKHVVEIELETFKTYSEGEMSRAGLFKELKDRCDTVESSLSIMRTRCEEQKKLMIDTNEEKDSLKVKIESLNNVNDELESVKADNAVLSILNQEKDRALIESQTSLFLARSRYGILGESENGSVSGASGQNSSETDQEMDETISHMDDNIGDIVDNKNEVIRVILNALEGASLPSREDIVIRGCLKYKVLTPIPLKYILQGVAKDIFKRIGIFPISHYYDTENRHVYHIMEKSYIKIARKCVKCKRAFKPPIPPLFLDLHRAVLTTINGSIIKRDTICTSHLLSKDPTFVELI